jgi:hypothetical protein
VTRDHEIAACPLAGATEIAVVPPEPIELAERPLQTFAEWMLNEARELALYSGT